MGREKRVGKGVQDRVFLFSIDRLYQWCGKVRGDLTPHPASYAPLHPFFATVPIPPVRCRGMVMGADSEEKRGEAETKKQSGGDDQWSARRESTEREKGLPLSFLFFFAFLRLSVPLEWGSGASRGGEKKKRWCFF